ncbi:MAG TPA: adenylate kinase [Planctomycetota bacterium]|nr:adenylate kinase [Planctomycetota bacterium]
MRLVFLGPPAAGKGTQAKLLSKEHAVPHLSTGDVLREAMAKGTPTGLRAKEFVDKGYLVPDEVVDALVRERLQGTRERFLLDGYPRNASQADELDRMLQQLKTSLTSVIYIHVADDTLVKRVSSRRSCPKCGAVYHLEAKPPKQAGVCDECGSNGLVQRPDDRAEVVRERLTVYHKNTAPLVERYKAKGLLRWIDGNRPIDDVARDVGAAAKTNLGGSGGRS